MVKKSLYEWCLETNNKRLLKEWDYNKNKEVNPLNIAYASNKKFHWMCNLGHKWTSAVNNRTTQNKNCPYCTNQRVLKGFNDLATKKIGLASEWHPTKNGKLTPSDVVYGSTKQVWWKCESGHEWKAKISYRLHGNHRCPKCTGTNRVSYPEKAISFYVHKIFYDALDNYYPNWLDGKEIDICIPSINLAIEYDGYYTHSKEEVMKRDNDKDEIIYNKKMKLIRVKELLKNTDRYFKESDKYILIERVLYNRKFDDFLELDNTVKLIFDYILENTDIDDEYKKAIKYLDIDVAKDYYSILKHMNIMLKQNSIVTTHPHLLKEWDYEKNDGLIPEQFSAGSTINVWWKCKTHGHSWSISVIARTNGRRNCPYCSNKRVLKGFNDLATTNSDIAKKWHKKLNKDLKPTDVVAGSYKEVYWQCSKHENHYWKNRIVNEVNYNTTDCPICTNRRVLKGVNDLATTNPRLASEWHPTKNGKLNPTDVVEGAKKEVWWLCSCGNEFKAYILKRKRCNNCNKNHN